MKRFISTGLLLSLITFGLPINSSAAIKINSSCKKEGQKVTEKSKVFVCKKVGKKLLWAQQIQVPNKGVVKPPTKVATISYWSSPSVYELLNLDSDPDRVMILIKKLDLRKQQIIWGSEARIFIYLVAGGEEFLHVNTLQQLIGGGSQDSALLSLWKKGAMDGATLKIAIGNLFLDKSIQLDTLIDATDLSSKMIPEKNWVLESKVDLKKIVRTVKTLPSATPIPSATPTPVSTFQNFGRAPYFEVDYSAGNFTISIIHEEIQLFVSNGFSPIGLKARVIDSAGRSTISSTLPIYPPYINGRQFVFRGFTSGDIHQISIAAIYADRTDNWSIPLSYSIVNRRSIEQKNQYPIGGKYLLGDIGPGGGRIFLTPESKNTQLFSDNLVKAQTPFGYYYEVFYPNWIGFAFRCHADEYDPAGLNSFIRIKDQFTNDDGQKNTGVMLNSGQCQQNSMIYHTKQFNDGSYVYPNRGKVNLSGLTDWFIPSVNEIRPLGSIRSSITFEGKQFGSSLWETIINITTGCVTSSLNNNGYQIGVKWDGSVIQPPSGGTGIVSSDLCLVRKFR